jgi:aminotransferase
VTDEIYEHMVYEGEHIPLASLPDMQERTITISGASKTFGVTGWRIGWVIAPEALTDAIRKVHDFLTVGAPAPLQDAIAVAIERLDRRFYEQLTAEYRARRAVLYGALADAGFRCTPPQGAYYILADFSELSDLPDTEFAVWLSREVGVTPVPGSSFFRDPAGGRSLVRFVFCKTDDILLEASRRLRGLRAGGSPSRRELEAAARSGLQS